MAFRDVKRKINPKPYIMRIKNCMGAGSGQQSRRCKNKANRHYGEHCQKETKQTVSRERNRIRKGRRPLIVINSGDKDNCKANKLSEEPIDQLSEFNRQTKLQKKQDGSWFVGKQIVLMSILTVAGFQPHQSQRIF